MKIGEKQRTLIATYVIEAVIHFGDTEELKFQNFSYLQHHIKSLLPASSNIKICNKFMLASKMLDLGKVYHVPVKETVKVSRNANCLSLSMSKSKSSTLPMILKPPGSFSNLNNSRGSIGRNQAYLMRPLSHGKFRSVDGDRLVREPVKFFSTKPSKLSLFARINSTEVLNPSKELKNFKRVDFFEKLQRAKDLNKDRDERSKPRRSDHLTPMKKAKDDSYLDKSNQKSDDKEKEETLEKKEFKRAIIKNLLSDSKNKILSKEE